MRLKHRVEISLAHAQALTQGKGKGAERSWWEADWKVEHAWISTWLWAWPLVKIGAMEAEVKARPSGQSWAEVWTQKEEEVWARAMKVWGGGERAWALTWALEEEERSAWKKGLARRRHRRW